MTPEQCRAARAMAGISQDDLAVASSVAKATIAAFELGQRQPYPRTLDAIRAALEARGVQLLEGGQVATGPGVAVAKASMPT